MPQDKRQELMDLGYVQTMDYFLNVLPEKKKKILVHYKNILKYLNRIKKYVSSNKIKQAREEIGLLYMDIRPAKKYIEMKYYDMVEEFKTNFMENIIPAASFFGIFNLRNLRLIETQINAVVYKFEEKILELESYIFDI